MSDGYAFDFHGLRLVARSSGALWWPERRWLIVADLHLGKSERMARRGGALLPPYETMVTLERLTEEIAATTPACVISLGDAFDDLQAAGGLPDESCAVISGLARGRDWIWVQGNHDPGTPSGRLPGRAVDAIAIGAVTLRHEPGPGPDIAGHFHPVLRLAGDRRRAFLIGANHLILPAFGAYTGGMDARLPPLWRLVAGGLGVACLRRAVPVPLTQG
ncbi:ligase-associated DNA damage response endonuclease PdeM [Paracoccus pacificus]|uniref:Ligase-associated DNA damage response endonuclease PdeM n=1 Tax=Paracoccus pacificus TaxID=1463598 RepID=A0ABW4R6Y8_9RHOB